MKANIYAKDGKRTGEAELPRVFETLVKPDVIKKAVHAAQANRRQRYGSDKLAGKRSSAHYEGLRRYRFTMMNREMARMPRIHGRGASHLAYTARVVPQAVKGRKAHPPKPEKEWSKKINKKEKQYAIMSALAASANMDMVRMKHKVDESPIILSDDFESISRTAEAAAALGRIVPDEMNRCARKKVRAGRGKNRGRPYRRKKGPLIITSKKCDLTLAAKGITGVDVFSYDLINAELLAPGAHPGRLLMITQSALQKLGEKFGAPQDGEKSE